MMDRFIQRMRGEINPDYDEATEEYRAALERIAYREVRHPWNVARIALGQGCAHPVRDFNRGWFSCVECGEDAYKGDAA